MDSRLRKWARHAGAKVIAGLLVGLGIMLWALSSVLQERFASIGLAVGIGLVVLGIIVGGVDFFTEEVIKHERRYAKRHSGRHHRDSGP